MEEQILPLDGRQVSRCRIGDWVFVLEFGLEEVFIVIEQSIQLTRDGQTFELRHGDLEELGKVVHLAGKTVERACALSDGTLEVAFREGSVIRVPPDWMFEAWRVEGPRDALVVCMPGGTLAIWE